MAPRVAVFIDYQNVHPTAHDTFYVEGNPNPGEAEHTMLVSTILGFPNNLRRASVVVGDLVPTLG